ncbi:MAG: FAD:protein FMN transferase [Gammaproteobacteria bacterium]|nr:FAD:protein FMN transferase [Gammaproteobacteria bacterium]
MTSAARSIVLRSLAIYPLLLALAACGNDLSQHDFSGDALGTSFTVSVVDRAAGLDFDELQVDVLDALSAVDKLASTWRDDSELSTLNTDMSIDWIPVSARLCELLKHSLEISEITAGAFDPTVGPLVNLWGFGPNGQVSEPPSEADIVATQHKVGYALLEVDCSERLVRKDVADVYVDLSGWAKGYAVDQLANLLDDRGIANYMVEIGGELRVKGHNRKRNHWAIGIEAPSTSERVPHAIVHVTNTSVATSGDYRNYFEHEGQRFSHTIDPRTGRPVTHKLAAVTVMDASAAYADAMATGLLVLGPDNGPELARELGVAAYFLVRDATGIREITTLDFDRLSTQ